MDKLKKYKKTYKHKQKWISSLLKKEAEGYTALFGSADWSKYNDKMKLALNIRYLSENGVIVTSKYMTEDELKEELKKNPKYQVPLCIVNDSEELMVNDIVSFEDATDLGFKEKEKQL